MSQISTDRAWSAEHRRIRRAYAARAARGADGAWFGLEGPAHWHRLEERYRHTQSLLEAHGFASLSGSRVLDVGCGDGLMLLELLQWGCTPRHLAGIELRSEPLERARERLPEADLRQGCASELPWPAGTFDLVCQHTVFSSILDRGLRRRIAEEVTAALAPGGAVLWYDTRRDNPHNSDVARVGEAELRELFPGLTCHLRRITFLPHVARRLPPWCLGPLYPLLASVPAWRSHLLALMVKEKRSG